MPINIENDTHWRTPDLRRLVQAAIDASDMNKSRPVVVKAIYNVRRRKKRRGSKSKTPSITSVSKLDVAIARRSRDTLVTFLLPKNGPRDIHSNAMVAIAASAGAPTAGSLLSASQTFCVAHRLVYEFSSHAFAVEEGFDDALGSDMPPAWADATKLLVCKVKDPKQDGTYLAFVSKKEVALTRAETAIEKEVATIEAAKRRLKKARTRMKDIEKSLRSARERRE